MKSDPFLVQRRVYDLQATTQNNTIYAARAQSVGQGSFRTAFVRFGEIMASED